MRTAARRYQRAAHASGRNRSGRLGRVAIELTDAIQDYLKEIYKLGVDGGRVSTRSVVSAQYMKASSGSGLWPTRMSIGATTVPTRCALG